MPKKGTGGTKKKTGSTRKTAGTAKKASPKKAASKTAVAPSRSYTPLYVAVIMVLLIVIVILVNRQIGDKGIVGTIKSVAKTERKKSEPPKSAYKEPVENAAARETKANDAKSGAASAGRTSIKLYLYKFDPRTEKLTLTSVPRTIESREPVGDAIRELIKGPSAREQRQDLLSAVPRTLKINSLRVANGKALIDFNGAIEENANGTILLNRIDQIVYTATQFDDVKAVEITVNGRKRRFIGGDGLSVGGTLRRYR